MKTVLITGATSGIGLQLTQDYLEAGNRVIACGRNIQVLNPLCERFAKLEILQFDVTNSQQTRQAIESMEASPDVWIFNAGNCEYIENGHLDSDLLRRVFEVNFIGLANSIESSQQYFKSGDSVVVVGSISSEVALPRAEAYGASKAAVSYLARTLQITLKPKGIHVSIVYPGFVETPLTDKNTFEMPMIVSAQRASLEIRRGIDRGAPYIYFPTRFTSILRLIGLLPYRWQNALTARLTQG